VPERTTQSSSTQAVSDPGQVTAQKPRKRRKSGDAAGSLQSLAVTLVVALFVITFVLQAFQIPSESMENTLLTGDYLLVDKIHYGLGGAWSKLLPYRQIRRGDIIVFRYPANPQQHFVKRVAGVPGDRIRLKGKQLYVNGRALRENYVVYRSPLYDAFRDDFPQTDAPSANVEPRWWLQMRSLVRRGELTVPPNKYFVLGDNRDESLDSRYWGFVPRESVIGQPLLIYWSMRKPPRVEPVAHNLGDKLLFFAYSLTHVFQQARWNRTLRIIN
jgi:signal peptidase I